MFKSKTKTTFDNIPPTSTTIIGVGTTISGNLESNGDIRIDGTLLGNLIAKAKVIVGASGNVEGNIDGKQADILGRVTGKIKIEELLYIHGKASIDGDLYAGKLHIEPTATFNGQCHMGANVVAISTEREVVKIANG